MFSLDTRFAKFVSVTTAILVANLAFPFGYSGFFPKKTGKEPIATPPQKVAATRVLSVKEMRKMHGSLEQNPYIAGSGKWGINYKGVDTVTGNFSLSATDLTFEGGYGIPVNVTRSYSANSADEGPFGVGWNLSADIRTTAGGLLKSAAAPIRSVPTNYCERAASQADPNVATQPAEAVVATDAGGKEETIQRDVDGILSTPPWDKNVVDSTYETIVKPDGSIYQVLATNTMVTPDGTTYVYAKQGSYPTGVTKLDGSGSGEPSNVLKIMSATDRHGNQTTYSYSCGTDTVSFAKSNGNTVEYKLTDVQMPNGHHLSFGWSGNRITSVSDNAVTNARVVHYTYDTAGRLVLVESPGGKKTRYGYDSPYLGNGSYLVSITDPRGLTTHIDYLVGNSYVAPYNACMSGVLAYRIVSPNNSTTHFCYDAAQTQTGVPNWYYNVSEHWRSPGYLDLAPDGVTILNRQVYPIPVGQIGVGDPSPTGYNTTVSHYMNEMVSSKWYSPTTQDLIWDWNEDTSASPHGSNTGSRWLTWSTTGTYVRSVTGYNFMGNPLTKTTVEMMGFGNVVRSTTVDYAYWGKEKYFQQKAVRSPKEGGGYRYSFTDYYDNTAAQGSKGQTYRVYSDAYTDWTGVGSTWKYDLQPSDASTYAAQFSYDSKGRPIDVWKLQKTTTTPWSYVQTSTTYGADTDGSWGQASSVTEDVGGIARTTQTLDYDSYGRAIEVQDASGKVFHTNYDADGQIQSVYRTDGGSQMVAEYTYGTTPWVSGDPIVDYGQVTSVTDGLSGVTQSITYTTTGAGIGQPASVSETNGSDSYIVSYTYNANGDRATSTYATPSGTSKWGYSDYVTVGMSNNPSRVFQTLTKLDASGNPTPEEFHYAYDCQGRLRQAAFAQTPQNTSAPYYSNEPLSRARASYSYDAGGRLTGIYHYWDTASGSQAVLANECDYSPALGLKTASRFYSQNTGNPSQFQLDRTETYGYDANLDYLTSANYNDGLPNANPTWSYDAAGNRNDSVCDNLNRATEIGGVSCTNDILGNRLTKGTTSYTWDALNRMTGIGSTSSYVYRADGLRVSKTVGEATTKYRYDGQMGMQDVDSSGVVMDYGLGARGIDYMARTSGTTTAAGFPVYDGHGNMVATLARSTGNTFTLGNQRSFDAWGSVRSGSGGDPTGRYCANIGHKQDDESGLIYMRARYYEPASGRFVSEDPGMDGLNWFWYCHNQPLGGFDPDGANWWQSDGGQNTLQLFLYLSWLLSNITGVGPPSAGPPTPDTLTETFSQSLKRQMDQDDTMSEVISAYLLSKLNMMNDIGLKVSTVLAQGMLTFMLALVCYGAAMVGLGAFGGGGSLKVAPA